MSRIQQDDGSEDVADFLERIRELGDRTKREDEERSRKLEEEILQGRKEREARRAERARSISPTKDSPLTTPPRQATIFSPASPVRTPTRTFRSNLSQDTFDTTSRTGIDLSSNDKAMPKTLSLNLDLEPSKPSPPPTSTLSRSGTLSWQQRPASKSGGSRPNSLLSLENKVSLSPRASPTPEPQSKEPSRQDVMRSLEGKDPSWFKQTADRGVGSAAYRKSQENDSMTGNRIQLPGLNSGSEETGTSWSQSRNSQDLTSNQRSFEARNGPRNDTVASTKSPLPSSSAQRFEPPAPTSIESPPLRQPAMSPAQRSISPERPISPTKGLGGFVQSAMLKRSDSLNKHKRAGSQASLPLNRNDFAVNNQTESEATKDASLLRSSKPQEETISQTEVPFPTSPSRSMDSKRWSPTKQSWLEGAISKSESPRPTSGNNQTPPMWLSELQRSRDSNSAPIAEKLTAHKPIEIGGLVRSSRDLQNTRPDLSPAADSGFKQDTAVPQRGNDLKDDKELDIRMSRGLGIISSDLSSPFKPVSPVSKASQPATKPDMTDSKSSTITSRSPPITSPKPDLSKKLPDSTQERKVPLGSAQLKSNISTSNEAKPTVDEPVKRDFRAGLKSTGASADKTKNDVPEFKNVFGKLKRTETKNYVAPDELKANILRGKTGLSLTSGPRPYEKKDDFKDSILKKKEEMKTGPSVKATSPEPVTNSDVPEAIAKQQRLAQAAASKSAAEQAKPVVSSPKPRFSRTQSASESNKPVEFPASRKSMDPELASPTITDTLPVRSAEAVKQSSVQIHPKTTVALEKKTSAPAQLQGSGLSNKFADRFNPDLAGILARGPPSTSNGVVRPARTASPTEMGDEPAGQSVVTAAPKAELTHATKSRAKGPKRRLPGNAKNSTNEGASKRPGISEVLESQQEMPDLGTPTPTAGGSTQEKPQAEPPKLQPKPQFSISNNARVERPPVTVSKPVISNFTKPSPRREQESFTEPREANVTISKPVISNFTKPGPRREQESFTNPSEGDGMKAAATLSNSMGFKDAPLQDQNRPPQVAPKSPELLSKSPKLPKSPPTPGSKALALARISSSGQASDRLQVPTPGGTLDAFFDNISLPKMNTDPDTQKLLSNQHPNETHIRTLKKDIWEIKGDGKRKPLSQHQEYILFEDHMYLCRHHYEDEHGKQLIDAYLWCGDGVSPAAIEDAQVFCGSTAREAGCKLQTLSQGKETVKFFEALGGIVITRRRDSATYMLCGRRHLGRIVFDEVEMSAESLCSGFTFIIATTGGDLYLWKGKGANADEIGCARLIGMDLGLTGEIEEVDEGKEPASLLQALKTTQMEPSSALWQHKASTDKYNTRLFSVDADARSRSNSALSNFAANMWRMRPSSPSTTDVSEGKVVEITPYSQLDIVEDQIFVLDAFFEIFVIAGSQTRSKFTSFAMALNFAQEYGILSVSIQDRPFIPKGYVVFLGAAGELPAGFRTAFRKWDPRIHRQQSSWAARNVIMPLNEALQALEGLGGGGGGGA